MLSVRRITPEDGDTLQRVRLAALRDAPSAFASVHAEEARRSAAEWSTRAAAGSSGFDRVTFFAVDAGEPVGLVGGFRPYPESADIELVSMWTAPPARRTGAGTLLVEALVGWAADGERTRSISGSPRATAGRSTSTAGPGSPRPRSGRRSGPAQWKK